jgi:hypothetical protein
MAPRLLKKQGVAVLGPGSAAGKAALTQAAEGDGHSPRTEMRRG